jgi:hypothetical protein
VITMGIDLHSRAHSAAALDDHGRILAELTVGSNAPELDRLARWIAGVGPERLVAIEGARGFGLALVPAAPVRGRGRCRRRSGPHGGRAPRRPTPGGRTIGAWPRKTRRKSRIGPRARFLPSTEMLAKRGGWNR